MKNLLIVLFSLTLTMAATAQVKIGNGFRGGYRSGGYAGIEHYLGPRVTVIAPYRSMYPYYGYGSAFGYSPFYNPFYNEPRVVARPTQLDLQIDDIKNEYSFKISSVKHDKSLEKDDRKQKVRDLKHQREDAIIDAKKSYYKEQDEKNGSTDTDDE